MTNNSQLHRGMWVHQLKEVGVVARKTLSPFQLISLQNFNMKIEL